MHRWGWWPPQLLGCLGGQADLARARLTKASIAALAWPAEQSLLPALKPLSMHLFCSAGLCMTLRRLHNLAIAAAGHQAQARLPALSS